MRDGICTGRRDRTESGYAAGHQCGIGSAPIAKAKLESDTYAKANPHQLRRQVRIRKNMTNYYQYY